MLNFVGTNILTMSKTLFEPGSPTFNELVGNGKIHDVPKYQRDYSWDTEDWDDLWNDIEGIPEVNPRRTPSCPSRLQPLPLRLRLSLPVFPA